MVVESGHLSMWSTACRNTLFIGTNAELSTGRSEISDLFGRWKFE
jgi:hypothetical protein